MTVILNELRQKTIARDVESDYTRSYRSFAPQTDFSKRVNWHYGANQDLFCHSFPLFSHDKLVSLKRYIT